MSALRKTVGGLAQRRLSLAHVLQRLKMLSSAGSSATIVPDNERGLGQLDEADRTNTLPADDLEVLRFLTGRADRQCILMRPAMGAMADGAFSPIG